MKYSIINRTRFVAALACTVLGFAGFAHAKAAATQQSYNAEQPRKGTLNITVATELSGLVAAIGKHGEVLRLYIDRETNIYACVRETLQKDKFPQPPFSPYYMHVSMSFQ